MHMVLIELSLLFEWAVVLSWLLGPLLCRLLSLGLLLLILGRGLV